MGIVGNALTAARNAWAISPVGGGISDEKHTPSDVVHDEKHQVLRRFGSSVGRPVLMVPPLAAPATCFDLTPGQSVAEFVASIGRTPYLVDYGDITFGDRALGFEYWIDEVIPNAVRRVSEAEGGVDVDLISWSIGGTLCLLTAAANDDLPVRSLTTVGAPIDYGVLPTMKLWRAIGRLTRGEPLTTLGRLAGGVPASIVKATYRAASFERELKRPAFIARNITDSAALAKMEVLDRFNASLLAYPGRFYGQLNGRLMLANDLATGTLHLGDRRIELSDVDVPVLSVAGLHDTLTTVDCARAALTVLTGTSVRFETVPGSHLGILTGSGAGEGLWPLFDEFLSKLDAKITARPAQG